MEERWRRTDALQNEEGGLPKDDCRKSYNRHDLDAPISIQQDEPSTYTIARMSLDLGFAVKGDYVDEDAEEERGIAEEQVASAHGSDLRHQLWLHLA